MIPSPLSSKLYIPRLRPQLIDRSHLIEELNSGLPYGKLTLISAPAGYGKTTLLSKWLSTCAYPCTWLSLDEADNDFSRFLVHFVVALQKVAGNQFTIPNIDNETQRIAQSHQPFPSEWFLSNLFNAMAVISKPFIFVLDDYHVIDSKSVAGFFISLLEHLPPQIHVVIASRQDPELPLAKLRARSQLTELRTSDLRFTPDEASKFLHQTMGLNLSKDDVAILETRTEGWIAGLQLAALSMQRNPDTSRFIKAFAGSHRFVLDYLVEEVLQYQQEDLSQFLLQTAILNQLNISLCDEVTRREDSKSMLNILEHRNLFLVPMDDRRQWYRYHHLFADALRSHLAEMYPDQVPKLHQRASTWYAENNILPEAIHHGLMAKNFEYAADLLEQIWAEMDVNLQSNQWVKWVRLLPDDLFHVRPVLSVAYAWALLESGEIEACETQLQNAERWLQSTANMQSNEMVVVDKVQFRWLPATIATARTYLALALGNVSDTLEFAQQAFNLTSVEDEVRYTQSNTLLETVRKATLLLLN